jgi:hypothetical protein
VSVLGLAAVFFLLFRARERRPRRRAQTIPLLKAVWVGGASRLLVRGRTRLMVIPMPGWPAVTVTYHSGALVVRV